MDSEGSSSSSSSSWKKRFSIFSKDSSAEKEVSGDSNPKDGWKEAAAAEDSSEIGDGSDSWFDIGMNFCSEMELPARDDVDEDIAREAKRMMKEEGR